MIDIFSVNALAELDFVSVLEKSEELQLDTKFRGIYSHDEHDNIDISPIAGFHSSEMALPSHTQAGEPIYDAGTLGTYLKEKGVENRIYDDIGYIYENGVRQPDSWLKNPPSAPQNTAYSRRTRTPHMAL